MRTDTSNYYAFISYSHRDQKETVRLHRFLEHYIIPGSVRKLSNQIPKRIYPVFIDRDNLAGSQLDERLQLALENSEYLIVVCSPNSAKSSYVNDEVSYFISLGKAKKIIPYIISGIPNSGNEATECYVPALRDLNPLGADVSDLGEWKARRRLVASMFNLDLDLLVQKKRRIWKKRIGLAIAILAVGIGVWIPYSYYNIPRSSFYNDYVEVYGVPQGVGAELSDKEVQSVLGCYRITEKGGKVISLSFVNRHGDIEIPFIQTVRNESPIREYIYSDTGSLSNVAYEDEEGKIIANWQYSGNSEEVSLRDAEDNLVNLENFDRMISEGDYSGLEKTNGITAYKQVYDSDTGYLTKGFFTAYAGGQSLIPDEYGTYGREYTYDEEGHLTRVYYLGANEQRVCRDNGAYYIEYRYDDKGRVASSIYYDKDDNRINGFQSLAELRMIYEDDSVIQQGYDLNEEPALLPTGTHQYASYYDQNGYLITNRYLDENDQLCMSNYQYAECRMKYDSQGHQSEVTYWEGENTPCMVDGYHKITKEYSQQKDNQIVWEKHYDCDDNLCEGDDGYAMLKEIRDKNENVLLAEYYDRNGDPIACEAGYFRVTAEINDLGLEGACEYYDCQGEPFLYQGCYAKKTKVYNEEGLCTDVYFWDGEGNPAEGPRGYAHVSYHYNFWNRVDGNRFYDTEESLTNCIFGYAVSEYEFDNNGNLQRACFYNEQEEPAVNDKGIHEYRYKNENGRITEVSYWGADNTRILSGGVHLVQMDRDLSGNVLCLRNCGIHSEAVLCEEGFFSYEKEYNDEGNLLSIAYYDTDGNLAKEFNEGASVKKEYVYDDQGNIYQLTSWSYQDDGLVKKVTYDMILEVPISLSYYNGDETPATINGIHSIEYIHDEAGELIDIIEK